VLDLGLQRCLSVPILMGRSWRREWEYTAPVSVRWMHSGDAGGFQSRPKSDLLHDFTLAKSFRPA
jgi:hypothetical protein